MEKLRNTVYYSDNQLKNWIENESLNETLATKADAIRRNIYGDDVYIRGLIEFSNYCKNDCFYCGIRKSNKNVKRYRLTPKEILECTDIGYKLGFRTYVMQSGEDTYYRDDMIVKIIETVKNIAPGFGGINLEDISSPRCVYIEDKLKEILDIPVFHDDQHGTAIVTVAALINALKLVDKKPEDIKLVMSGAGAAGFSCAKLISDLGVKNIIVCDSHGAINKMMLNSGNPVKAQIAEMFNPDDFEGSISEAIKGADVFVGVSAPDVLTSEDIKNMNDNAIVFAMANPVPEIDYNVAKEAGARIVATGRSDFPNQINNVLAFPGIFKGALESHAPQITDQMKMTAAKALASFVKEEQLNEEYIIPSAFEEGIAKAVSDAVKTLN